jgi:hypothetical protein
MKPETLLTCTDTAPCIEVELVVNEREACDLHDGIAAALRGEPLSDAQRALLEAFEQHLFTARHDAWGPRGEDFGGP